MPVDLIETIEDRLLKFDKKGMKEAVGNAVSAGLTPTEILGGIRKGFDTISRKYDAGEFFLSELIMSGETAKEALEVLKPHFQNIPGGERKQLRVVIGTVEGDIHDIGKNIVSTILLSSGFDVYDLGADVKSDNFVNEVKKTDAQILAMSALLTTTMQNMRTVIEDLKKGGSREKVKVIIGGQPVTDEFARRIGADAYVDDAPKVVKVVENLVEAD